MTQAHHYVLAHPRPGGRHSLIIRPMKPSITTSYLGRLWLVWGLLVALGGIVAIAAALALSQGALSIDLSSLPAPFDFISKNALTIGPIQFLVGIFLSIGGFALMRKRNSGRWILQSLSVALMLWFVFLGVYTHRASEEGRQVLFPASLPICFGLVVLGSSVWALSRPKITRELSLNK
ncbi:MAG: hypothetical protein JWM59_3078 [Verrucomicrobiales bacterium]|nr:hypothetical protein [Verrucomicrobiales bacterium]